MYWPYYEGYHIAQLALDPPGPATPIPTIAEARWQRDGSVRWVIKRGGDVLNHDYEWEYEPIPSSRDDDFKARTGWANLNDLIRFWQRPAMTP